MYKEKQKNANFYIGSEAEHTPAFSKRTLFVLSYETAEEVLQYAKNNNVKHVAIRVSSEESVTNCVEVIEQLLSTGYIVTLDYDITLHHYANEMLSDVVWTSRNFIPLVRNNISQLDRNPNLTLKVEDDGNFGVWCCSVEKLKDNNSLTQWTDYETYTVIDSISVEREERQEIAQKEEIVKENVQEQSVVVEKDKAEENNTESVVQDILASHTQENKTQQETTKTKSKTQKEDKKETKE